MSAAATPERSPPARLAVMLSGGGLTLVNLAKAIREGRLNAQIALVIASRACAGCDRAREIGVEPLIMPGVIGREALERVLTVHRVNYMALAGYLKYLQVPAAFAGRVVNIHPSLLPMFGGPGMYGERVHKAVLASGVKVSGCSVHFVDEQYDHGPVIVQRTVPVEPGDTPESLGARVFTEECIAYPDALRRLIDGRLRIEGGLVRTVPARAG